jgi:DtxR family Mn-dependent transcriptional regulator
MTPPLTISIQDYLKNIYELTENGEPASTSSLAARLGVSAASVTGMVQKLAAAQPPLVAYRKHQGAKLTAAGRRAALEVIRHHRLLESWLVQTLGYTWDEVHGEAEKLEHAISESLEKRIATALGNPARDPHGEPIPSEDLIMPREGSIALATVMAGENAIVRRVQTNDGAMLKHLEALGLTIGAHLRALGVSRFDQVMTVRVRGQQRAISLGPAITSLVYVDSIKPDSKPRSRINP